MMQTRKLMLADVVEGLTGLRPEGVEQLISTPVIDSRNAKPGALFFAFEGDSADGHDFVADAFSRGAVAAIVEHDVSVEAQTLDVTDPAAVQAAARNASRQITMPLVLKTDSTLAALWEIATFWRQQHDVRIVGVTGSVGKTTTKELAAAVLARRYATLKSEGSYNNEIGLPLTLLHLTGRHQRSVLEMGMYDVGEISDLVRIARPQVGVVTIVRPVHLERAGTLERIVQAKTELVEGLPPAPEGVAVLNYDDDNVRKMAQSTEARIFYYGLSSQADLWADEIEGLGLQGIRFRLHYCPRAEQMERPSPMIGGDMETLYVRIPLLGRHSVHTALRAAAVGLVEGLTWQEIIEGLRGVEPSSQLRLVAVPGPKGAIILDDTYNASPSSTLAALNLLDEMEGRKIAVLGDMLELGPYEQIGHEKVGMRALEVTDVLVTVGELGRIIGETAVRWGMPPEQVYLLENNDEVVALLERVITGNDIILVKGSRSMTMEDIVNALSVDD
jgi:UDP-N-acetylmuramoyl-tripeptide--D-alanyl-D-alanine ligase